MPQQSRTKQPAVDTHLAVLIRRLARQSDSAIQDAISEWVSEDLARQDNGHIIVELLTSLKSEDNLGSLQSVVEALNDSDGEWIVNFLTHDQAVQAIACLVDLLLDHENDKLDEAIIDAVCALPEETLDQLRGELIDVLDDDDIWDIIKKMFRAVS